VEETLDHIKDKISVEVTTLDSIIKEPVDLIKSDTEGNEIAVLQGARELLKNDVKLIIEIWNRGITASGKKPQELFDVLTENNFGYLYMIDEVSNLKHWNKTNNSYYMYDVFNEAIKRSSDISVNLLCSKNKLEVM